MKKWTNLGKYNIINKTLDITGFIFIILFLVISIITWKNAPDIVPTHYNSAGIADSYGSKNTMLYIMLPLTLVFYIGLFILSKFPQIYNYPVKITDENKQRLYDLSSMFIRILNIELVLILLFITASTGKNSLSTSFLPISMIILFGTVIIFIYKISKKK